MSETSRVFNLCSIAYNSVMAATPVTNASAPAAAADGGVLPPRVHAIHAARIALFEYALDQPEAYHSVFANPECCDFGPRFLRELAAFVGIENDGRDIQIQIQDAAAAASGGAAAAAAADASAVVQKQKKKSARDSLCAAFLFMGEESQEFLAFQASECDRRCRQTQPQQQPQQPLCGGTPRVLRLQQIGARLLQSTASVMLELVSSESDSDSDSGAGAAGCAGCVSGCIGCVIDGTAGDSDDDSDASSAAAAVSLVSAAAPSASAIIETASSRGQKAKRKASVMAPSKKKKSKKAKNEEEEEAAPLPPPSAAALAALARPTAIISHLIIFDPENQHMYPSEQRPFIEIEPFSRARFNQLETRQVQEKKLMEEKYKASKMSRMDTDGEGDGEQEDARCLVFGILCATDGTATASSWVVNAQLNHNTGYFARLVRRVCKDVSDCTENSREHFSAAWTEKAPTETGGSKQRVWRTTVAGLLQRTQEREANLKRIELVGVRLSMRNGGNGYGTFKDIYRWRSPIEIAMLEQAAKLCAAAGAPLENYIVTEACADTAAAAASSPAADAQPV